MASNSLCWYLIFIGSHIAPVIINSITTDAHSKEFSIPGHSRANLGEDSILPSLILSQWTKNTSDSTTSYQSANLNTMHMTIAMVPPSLISTSATGPPPLGPSFPYIILVRHCLGFYEIEKLYVESQAK